MSSPFAAPAGRSSGEPLLPRPSPGRRPPPWRCGRLGWWRWPAAAAVVAVALALLPSGATGELRVVAVATRPLAPGTVIAAGDLDWRSAPVALVPPGVLATGDDPVGRTVVAAVEPGEPVVTARLAPPGATGPAALAGPGRRAVRLRDDAVTPAVRAGDRVDLYGAGAAPPGFDGPGAGGDGGIAPVAEDAVVVATADGGLTVAVDEREAATTAAAVLDGRVVVVVRGPPPAR